MRKLNVVILLVIMCSSAMLAQGQDPTANPAPFGWSSDLINEANKGDVTAMFQLGYCYYFGSGAPLCPSYRLGPKTKEAFPYLERAAQKGHVFAMYLVGNYSFYGLAPMIQDYEKARQMFEKAASKGCADAMANLGNIYSNGSGVKTDAKKALEYTRKAAELGSPAAQYNMFVLLKNSDKANALKWLEKSAEQNYAIAQRDWGLTLMHGDGIPSNPSRAVQMTKAAAKNGYFYAWNDLGYWYLNGIGVDKDKNIAAIYFYKGAMGGVEDSKTNLQVCYQQGAQDAIAYENYSQWMLSLAQKEKSFNVDGQTKSVKKSAENFTIDNPQPTMSKHLSDIDKDIPKNNYVNDKIFVVIFANEIYQEAAPVEYAQNDGEAFKKYCNMVLGIPEKNIHLRKNATKNNMISELVWIKDVAEAFDGEAKFIVYYAGHGIPDEKSNTAYLLPVDGLATNTATAYSLAEFYRELSHLKAANITVFMDACFSGSQRGNGMLASARGVVIKPREETPAGNMVVFSAAQGDETAYPYKEKEHGLFTYFLLKKLRDTKGDCTLQELGDYIQTNVKQQSIVVNNKKQTPSVSASQQLSDSWKTMKLR